MNWLSAHIFHSWPYEPLLIKAIKPFVQEVIQKEWAKQYFFIRYFENGFHIRLRFFGEKEVLDQKLKPYLIQYFEDYLRSNPSKTHSMENFSGDIYPNNSIQFIDYQPEVDRYGGKHALRVAEKHFYLSSNASLEAISQAEDWSYDEALGTAIQMQLGFIHSMNLSIKDGVDFFAQIYSGWLPRAYDLPRNASNMEILEKKNEVTALFEKTYVEQEEVLLPFLGQIWDALESKQLFEDDWMNHWVEGNRLLYNELIGLQKEGKFEMPTKWADKSFGSKTTDEINVELWSVYSSYVHMINNRLGISNRDEAYLGYLLIKCLKNMKEGISA